MKLVVLYPLPKDVEAFETVYNRDHVAMAVDRLAGKTKMVATKVLGSPQGKPAFHRIAEIHFSSMDALQACAASEGGKQTIAHAVSISSGGAPTFLVAEEETFVFQRPGWSTRLLQRVLAPSRTIGLDASFIVEAGHERIECLEFAVWDVTQTPFPVPAPTLLLCRFLLTHLCFSQEVLTGRRRIVSGGAVLLIHEDESLQAENQELRRYYELVGEFQKQYGQDLAENRCLNTWRARLESSSEWQPGFRKARAIDGGVAFGKYQNLETREGRVGALRPR